MYQLRGLIRALASFAITGVSSAASFAIIAQISLLLLAAITPHCPSVTVGATQAVNLASSMMTGVPTSAHNTKGTCSQVCMSFILRAIVITVCLAGVPFAASISASYIHAR